MLAFHKKRYSRICIVCTVYSLFEYLLYSSYEEIEDTFFIFEKWMWPQFGNKFNNSYCMHARGMGRRGRNIMWIYWYYLKWFRLPAFKGAELFTLDHLPYHPIFIGRHKYTLLEDGPYCHTVKMKNNVPYSVFEEREAEHLPTFSERFFFKFRKIVYGPVYFNRWGKNNICSDIILSTDDYLDYFKDKTIHHIKLNGIWDSFPINKQEFILNVFNMTTDDINLLRSKKVIILTQPLWPDYISEEEHGNVWKSIISKYPISDILVKPHPRDNYKYENDIEGLTVFRKKIPSQFFDVLNLHFSKAVTTFSSSVFGLNATEIDWYGTEVSQTIFDRIGSNAFIPDGMKVNHCKL